MIHTVSHVSALNSHRVIQVELSNMFSTHPALHMQPLFMVNQVSRSIMSFLIFAPKSSHMVNYIPPFLEYEREMIVRWVILPEDQICSGPRAKVFIEVQGTR